MGRRIFIVVLLSLLSIALWAPDVRRAFGHPLGLMNYVVADDGAVVPWDPGWRGGHRPKASGYLDLQRSPLVTRVRALRNEACWQPAPGLVCDAWFRKDGREYHFVALTTPEPAANAPVVLIRVSLALLWLVAAAALVLLRPSRATWAFFALSLYGWTPNNIAGEIGPAPLQLAMSTFMQGWEIAIPFAAPVFALYLLQDLPVGWRRTALVFTYAFAAVFVSLEIAAFLLFASGNGALVAFHIAAIEYTGPFATWLATAFLFVTFLDSAKEQRQRIRWVLLGFFFGSIALSLTAAALQLSYVFYSLTQAGYVLLITASTAYAILKHRIVDVNVVLSRTLVYTILSAAVVGLFALVDLFVSRTLSESNAGLMADVALALVLGFFMNTMHHRVDRLVDGILFRRRHLAEEHVALVAQSLRHAEHEDVVNRMLIEEPVRSFGLVFGALARFAGSDALEVLYEHGGAVLQTRIANAETLRAYLTSERKALVLGRHFWSVPHLSVHDVEPAIAVPVFSHGDLEAVAFYSPHRNGTELDGDEVDLINRVADAAGAAYDRLEARALRERIEQIALAT